MKTRKPNISYKVIKDLIMENNMLALALIIEVGQGENFGNWLYDNIPTEEKYDEMFEMFEYYYDTRKAETYSRVDKSSKYGIRTWTIGVRRWAN